MRRIAIINQKGGVGKTTTTANLGAALAIQGRRVVVVDMDAQANLSLSLGIEANSGTPTSYTVLTGTSKFADAIRPTTVPRLSIVPANLDLSGAELELAAAMGREFILRDAIREWSEAAVARTGHEPADYVLFDCPPSLGLLSINALATAGEVLITMQTEFLALQGMSKLVEVVQLLKKRLNPELVVTGIVPCLYDSRLRLAREVLGEIRTYFRGQVFPHPVRSNVKLAEAPSFGQTVFEYAPDSNGAEDYMRVAREVVARESRDPQLADLPPFEERARLPVKEVTPPRNPPPRPPPPKKSAATSAPVVDPVTETAAWQTTATNTAATEPATAKATVTPKPTVTAKPTATAKPRAEAAASKPESGGPPQSPDGGAVAAQHDESTRSNVPPAASPTTSSANPSAAASETSAVNSARANAVRPATPSQRILRVEDVPPLPPDAFEILSILPTDT